MPRQNFRTNSGGGEEDCIFANRNAQGYVDENEQFAGKCGIGIGNNESGRCYSMGVFGGGKGCKWRGDTAQEAAVGVEFQWQKFRSMQFEEAQSSSEEVGLCQQFTCKGNVLIL